MTSIAYRQQEPYNPAFIPSAPVDPAYYPPVPTFNQVTGMPIDPTLLPPSYEQATANDNLLPAMTARAMAVAKANFSVPVALISAGATLALSCALGMSPPAVMTTTLLAGGVFGFLGTLEPTVTRVQHFVPSRFSMNWFGFGFTPGYTFETTHITDWTHYLGVFLRTLIAVNVAMKDAKKAEEKPQSQRQPRPVHVVNNDYNGSNQGS